MLSSDDDNDDDVDVDLSTVMTRKVSPASSDSVTLQYVTLTIQQTSYVKSSSVSSVGGVKLTRSPPCGNRHVTSPSLHPTLTL